MIIKKNVPLAPLTYYKIGGPARFFVTPANETDLKEVSEFIRSERIPFFILGAGSNILVPDEGFAGMVIHTANLDRTFEIHGSSEKGPVLEVGSSVKVIEVLRHCMSAGVGGFEFLVGIPGSMGGVLQMNAGTKLGEVKDVVLELIAFDLETQVTRLVTKKQMQFSYRKQNFLKDTEIILRASFQGTKAASKDVQDTIQNLLNARKKTQPIDKPSCGSVFKNPDPAKGVFAWDLIEKAGLRGYKVGRAQISPLHTNFIVNLGGATASDVLACIQEAKQRVLKLFYIQLEEEVKILKN